MKLTKLAIRQAAAPGKPKKLADGQGLYLLVNPSGAKYWRFKYHFSGKERLLALGVYPEVGLVEARGAHQKARQLLREGRDPNEAKKQHRLNVQDEAGNSFIDVAEDWVKTRLGDKSTSHRERTHRLLTKDLYPALGKRPVNQVSAPELLRVLRKVESRGALDMANRARQTAGQVFRFGIITGKCERDPSRDLAGALKTRQETHYAALVKPAEVAGLLVAIDNYHGSPVIKAVLKLSALVFQRPKEVRTMQWAHINWDKHLWEIPAAVMKRKADHVVPLARQSLGILKDLHPLTGQGKYVFPSPRGRSRPVSNNGARTALRTMGYTNNQMTPHGFRAMARTLLDEELHFRVEYIEQQLSHEVRDMHGRAYNRTQHLKERQAMMQRWADYLDELSRGSRGDEGKESMRVNY